MRQITAAVLTVLAIPLWAAPGDPIKTSFQCVSVTNHHFRVTMTRSADLKTCSAISVNSAFISGNLLAINGSWSCEVTELSKNPTTTQELVELENTKAVGSGPEGERVNGLRMIWDTALGQGVAIGTKLDKTAFTMICLPETEDVLPLDIK